MRKKWLLLMTGLMVIFLLAACGTKSQEDVVKELNGKLGDLSGYKVNAKMTLKMGKTHKCIMWKYGIKTQPFTASI